MTVLETRLPGLVLLEPRVFGDARGAFFESYQRLKYAEIGIDLDFPQDNVSISHQGVLRGLHFQNPRPQAKLVQVLAGEVWDVAVDIRHDSPTFGEWEGHYLSADNRRQFFIPAGFAHGFVVTQGPVIFSYKCSDLYHAAGDGAIRYDDPDLAIAWPNVGEVTLSDKDRAGARLAEIPADRLRF